MESVMTDAATPLKEFKATKKFFVGIDSDGCVFDTMGIKQRECFCPWTVAFFNLQPVAEAARECRIFADLFSRTRGANRHKTLKRILSELLPNHPHVRQRGFKVPQLPHYFAWVDDPKSVLSNDGLNRAVEATKDPMVKKELEQALAWSKRVNQAIADIVRGIPPFPYVRECLEKIQKLADVIVVSATPGEALIREWQEHDIAKFVAVIAGQEMGTKAQHLEYATKDRYEKDHVLMVGDAPGDLKAARVNNALFFPIVPGKETESWKRFFDEAFDGFIKGKYTGGYEKKLITEFESCLPEKPPWER
jgi:phosphoglycolate phosphatase-like HAD superfamily hydrolase